MYKLLYPVFILSTVVLSGSTQDSGNSWTEPDAWGKKSAPIWRQSSDKETDDQSSRYPVCNNYVPTTDEGVALIYYKKFILTLFNRRKLQYNEESGAYERTLKLSLRPSQLENLEQLQDPRDIDSILIEIITKAKTGTFKECPYDYLMPSINLINNIFKNVSQIIKMNEVRFILLVTTMILCSFYLHRRFNIGFVTMIIISTFLFGYFINYLECNRKLEVEGVIEFMNEDESRTKHSSWYSSIASSFANDKNSANIRKIRNSRNIKLSFCRPDHVLIIYANEVFFKQFEIIVEKLTDTISKVSTHLPYPLKWIVPILMPIIVFILFRDFLKSLYKHLLDVRGWSNLQYRSRQEKHPSHLQISSEDRLSGENLKLLLNTIKAPNVLVVNGKHISTISAEDKKFSASGVEEIATEYNLPPLNLSNTSSKTSLSNSGQLSGQKLASSIQKIDKCNDVPLS